MARKRKPEETTPSGSGVGRSKQSQVALADAAIRQRAHAIYEERIAQGLPGDAEGDWLRAEAELGRQAKPLSS